MSFDYIKNSICTCVFICICMQICAGKIHPKPLTIVTARKGTKAAVSRGRRLSFFVLNTPIFSEMF